MFIYKNQTHNLKKNLKQTNRAVNPTFNHDIIFKPPEDEANADCKN